MTSFNEKLISDFMSLGNIERKDAVIALQVYLELSEIKKYWDVECKYHEVLKMLYVTAKRKKSESPTIFVPKSVNAELNFNKMHSYFQLCEGCDVKRVFLALIASDSTCVYYQLSDGLCEPKNLENKQSKDNKREKLDADIRKNRTLIEHAAMCGIPITMRESSNTK